MEPPKCQKCNDGVLIPLSDYGQDGASVMYKAWACTNPYCGFSLRIDKGEVGSLLAIAASMGNGLHPPSITRASHPYPGMLRLKL
jgi:hypothetical protein